MLSNSIVPLLILALAQPVADQRDTAKREFDRGMHYYNLGQFALALEHFKAAYEVSPHADLLFDIGQCHRNLGQTENAIFFFERYVEQLPEGQDVEEVKSLLVELNDRRPIVYDPPPLTATMSANSYDLTLPFMPPPKKKEPLVEKWWFWAAVMGAATVAAGSVVLIATLTDPESPDSGFSDP